MTRAASKTKRKAATPRGKSIVPSRGTLEFAGGDRLTKRRSFSLIDRLPQELREDVLERLLDANTTYADIQRHVLLETCPPRLREQLAAKLDRFKADRKDRASAARDKQRRRCVEEISKALEPGETAPVMISDDSFTRAYRSVGQTMAALQRDAELYERLQARSGGKGLLAIGSATAGLLQIRIHDAVKNAKDIKALCKLPKVLSAGASYLKAAVDADRQMSKQEDLLERVTQAYIDSVNRELADHPELRARMVELLRSAKKRVAA